MSSSKQIKHINRPLHIDSFSSHFSTNDRYSRKMMVVMVPAVTLTVTSLLKAVSHACKKSSDFRSLLDRLQSTLKIITLQLDTITRLNPDLNIEALDALVSDGIKLVQSCSEISSFNIYNKMRYENKLLQLESDLKHYFTTDALVKELMQNPMDLSASAYVENNGFFLMKEHIGTPYDLYSEEIKAINKLVKEEVTCKYIKYTRKDDDNNIQFFIKISSNSVGESEFRQRMENIAKIGQHPYVKLPFGYYYSDDSKFLLYDYMPGCTLHQLLTEGRSSSLGSRKTWNRNMKTLHEAAIGISHIHSMNGFMIHGNINSANIILTGDLDGCISNFGLSTTNNHEEEEVGAVKTREATLKSDVYDFGILLLSLINLCDTHLLWHPNMLREERKLKTIGQSCTNDDPTKRPYMDVVVRDIKQIMCARNPGFKLLDWSQEVIDAGGHVLGS